MDVTAPDIELFSKKEQKLIRHVEKILHSEDLTPQRQLLEKITTHLEMELLDFAAALVLLSQSHLYYAVKPLTEQTPQESPAKPQLAQLLLRPIPPPKMVRYRIDVGQKHQVTVDEIKKLFIEEAGVDKKHIGEVDIRYHYTMIELPEGMPTDIYQLLTTVCLKEQPLNIKRLKYRGRYNSGYQPRKK